MANGQTNNKFPNLFLANAKYKNINNHNFGNWEYPDEPKDLSFPTPEGELRTILSPVKEIYLAGGGGAGRALPGAIEEACKYGLNPSKLEGIISTSVGAMMGLTMALGVPPHLYKKVLADMPADKYQDWSLRSILQFFTTWGLCAGNTMPEYFKKLIKEWTGLDDPTFLQLYQAGFTTEFGVVATNVTKHKMKVFSYKTTPHEKVAAKVALSCGVPILYPPQWHINEKGEKELLTDGGLVGNYPWNAGNPRLSLDEKLGIIFVNTPTHQRREENNPPHTFWEYLWSIISMYMFQEPIIEESIKARTIAIDAGKLSRSNFDADPEGQKKIDEVGRVAVSRFIRHLSATQQRESLMHPIEPKKRQQKTFLPGFTLRKHLIINNANAKVQKNTLDVNIKESHRDQRYRK
jgi:predicted acylesterase/phospholipase RssA